MATSWLQSALSAVGVGSERASNSSTQTRHGSSSLSSARNGSNTDIALGTTTSAATPFTGSQAALSASNLPDHNARARIVIVGDPGTGRSTLLQLLTSVDASTRLPDDQEGQSAPLQTAPPMPAGAGDPSGTFTGVRLHTVASTFKSFWLELVTLPRGHFGSGARATIYSGVDGVIALYDAAVPRTLDAMWKHVGDVLTAIGPGATILKPGEDLGARMMGGGSLYDNGPAVPVLVIGTKCDLVPGLAPSYSTTGSQGGTPAVHSRAASISEVVGINEFVMSKYSPPPPERFLTFFDQVIAARYFAPSPHVHQYQHQHSAPYTTSASAGGLSFGTTGHSPTSYSYGAPPSPMASTMPAAGHAPHHLLAPTATPLLSSVHTPSVPTPKMHRSTLLQSGVVDASESAASLVDMTSGSDVPASAGQGQPPASRRRMVVAVGGGGGLGVNRLPTTGGG